MKQKDYRLRLRSDTFLILLFINTYVSIPDIYHSPNIAVAQKYGFESFFCWLIFPCAFKGFEVLLTCLCDPQWKRSLSSILGLHHLSHFWPLFASKQVSPQKKNRPIRSLFVTVRSWELTQPSQGGEKWISPPEWASPKAVKNAFGCLKLGKGRVKEFLFPRHFSRFHVCYW